MSDLPLGWATDIAVLQHMGSTIDNRGDHIVVRTPEVPLYHWGNCIFVTDPDAVDDAQRWVDVFESDVPEVDWLAVGLVRMPADVAGWARHGAELEFSDVLATSTLPAQSACPHSYDVHPLVLAEDWEQFVQRDIALNEEERRQERESHERFARERARAYRAMAQQNTARFFGAFSAGRLVAELGIVRCGEVARYQTVGTDQAHRGRGLASHLLGVAGAWARDEGCNQWVIVTEATNPAGRVYRRAGFVVDAPLVTAYRRPPVEG